MFGLNYIIERKSVYYYAILVLLLGLVLSPFVNGVMHLFLLLLLIIVLPKTFVQLFTDKKLQILALFYLIHLLGLLYTSDFDFGLKEIRVKSSFVLFPFVFSVFGGFTKKQWRFLLWFFSLFVVIATVFGYFEYWQRPEQDSRNYSVIISHIRFSLIIVALIFFQAIELIKSHYNVFTWIRVVLIVYLFSYLLFISSLSALVAFVITFSYFIFHNLKFKYTWVLIAVIYIIPLVYFAYVLSDFIPKKSFEQVCLESGISGDENYYLKVRAKENGFFVGIDINEKKIISSWNAQHQLKINESTEGESLKYTLYRYLTSMNLTKDSVGLAQLSVQDVENIKNGVANYISVEKSAIYNRIYNLIWEFDRLLNKENVSGHSLTQRFVFWQTAINIIKDNFWLGVGTGDLPMVYQAQYLKDKTMLEHQFRLRTHNQFLSFFVGFGLIGAIVVLFSLYFPFFKYGRKKQHLIILVIIMSISMLTEDTFESQAGASFFALFYSLLIYSDID
ncbi:MAG: O-antigen ligase family protein [Bacteroidales bacterium]|nr:O-antigen ligase family protein [Bacteroidales bacterium]